MADASNAKTTAGRRRRGRPRQRRGKTGCGGGQSRQSIVVPARTAQRPWHDADSGRLDGCLSALWMHGGQISKTENEDTAAELRLFGCYISRGGIAVSCQLEGRGRHSKHHAHSQMEFQSQRCQMILLQPSWWCQPTALSDSRRRRKHDPTATATAIVTQTKKSHHRSSGFHHALPLTSTLVGVVVLFQGIGNHADLGASRHGRRTQHWRTDRLCRQDHS